MVKPVIKPAVKVLPVVEPSSAKHHSRISALETEVLLLCFDCHCELILLCITFEVYVCEVSR